MTGAYPVDVFPRLSPLLGLTASLASRTLVTLFWPALLVLVATLVLGRAFCAWVCPMGTTLDICDKLFKRKPNAIAGRKPTQEILRSAQNDSGRSQNDSGRAHYGASAKPAHRRWKFALLAFLLICSAFGLELAGWFDPLSVVTRSYALALQPYANYLSERVLDILFLIPPLAPILYPFEEFLRAYVLSFQQLIFSAHVLFAMIFVGIVALGALNRRFWCRSLCPLGALLALAGRYPLLRRTVSDECTHCLSCQRACMTDAIADQGEKTLRGECVYCFTCEDICPVNAISFSFRRRVPQSITGGVLSRRALLTTTLAGTAVLPALKLNYPRRSLYPWVIRPPGVEGEKEFLAKCVRCGECMKVCLKNALHPTLFEGGAEGLWTPKLVPRVGYCEYNCTLCGQVCPSGAIPELNREQKHKAKMGIAYFEKNRCIPWVAYENWSEKKQWSKSYNCAVCEEHCPTAQKAIRFSDVTVETAEGSQIIRRPIVVAEECVGCGICENVCPLDGPAAVRVISKNAAKTLAQKGIKPEQIESGSIYPGA
ncbi:MAG: 4Fe-4S binding protein [Candidatus Lindowbacteria bacterium]|nr:4Fe-4S binding protein [Candidatus Lindowbacteria bacterium]